MGSILTTVVLRFIVSICLVFIFTAQQMIRQSEELLRQSEKQLGFLSKKDTETSLWRWKLWRDVAIAIGIGSFVWSLPL